MGKLPMKQLIYTFKDINIDAIIEKHIELLKNQNQPQRIITNFDKVTCDSSFVAKIETVEGANKSLPKNKYYIRNMRSLFIGLFNDANPTKRETLPVSIRKYYKLYLGMFILIC